MNNLKDELVQDEFLDEPLEPETSTIPSVVPTTSVNKDLPVNNAVVQATQKNLDVAETQANSTMMNMQSLAYQKINTSLAKEDTDLNEAAKQLVDVATTARAVDTNDADNQEFLQDIKNIKQDELKVRAQRLKLAEDTAKIESKKARAEAMFNFFRPILEMDFSHLIPDRDKERQNEKQKISYQDRSYGVTLMVLMLVIFTPIYCIFSILLAMMNGINAIFLALRKFSKCAMVICTSLFILALLALLAYVIILVTQNTFGFTILP